MGASTHIKADKANAKRRKKNYAARKALQSDNRRFVEAPVPTKTQRNLAPADATRSMHKHKTARWTPDLGESILKPGIANSKIGGAVLVGHLKGAAIFTLSLEERVTCPRSCKLWRECYGNNMHLARRWQVDAAFFERVSEELHAHCATFENVLIRLHVLGDFFSKAYLAFWVGALGCHDNLHVFGFTAHGPKTRMGCQIAEAREVLGTRFSIRHSGYAMPYGSFVIPFDMGVNKIGDAILCPEQRNSVRGPTCEAEHTPEAERKLRMHCGSCGLCWKAANPIIFIEH